MSEPRLKNHYDVAIVGAGIIGCSTALYLAKKGIKVALIDRGKAGNEQSTRAWGFIRKQGRHPAEIPLADAAISLWDALTEVYGPDSTQLTKAGVVMPAETEADEEIIQRAYKSAQAQNLPSEILTPTELAEKCPELKGGWRSALFTSGDGHADPERATQTVLNAALEYDVALFEGCAVTGFEQKVGRVEAVRTSHGSIRAGQFLVAGGIGSRKLVKLLGFNPPIQVIRSSVFRSTKGRPFTDIAMWCPKVAFRPNKDGSFVVGNGYRGAGTDYDLTLDSVSNLRYFMPAFLRNYRQLKLTVGKEMARSFVDLLVPSGRHKALVEPPVNAKKVRFNLDQINAHFPVEQPLDFAQKWAGRLDITPDLIPIIDRLHSHQNVFVACGFSGHGFALGPAIGSALTAWMTQGKPSLDLSAFNHTRFETGEYEVIKAM